MIAADLIFAWCWDARPLPGFPLRTDIWTDGVDWEDGHWLNGKLPSLIPPTAFGAAELRAVSNVSGADRTRLVEHGHAKILDA